MPLKFAFFLLTDKNGDINLDVPVSGNLNDPEVSVSKIVWQTFKNVIGKTVAAPVNLNMAPKETSCGCGGSCG